MTESQALRHEGQVLAMPGVPHLCQVLTWPLLRDRAVMMCQFVTGWKPCGDKAGPSFWGVVALRPIPMEPWLFHFPDLVSGAGCKLVLRHLCGRPWGRSLTEPLGLAC